MAPVQRNASLLVSLTLLLGVLGVVASALGHERTPDAASARGVDKARNEWKDYLDSMRADEGELGDDGIGVEDPSGAALDAFYEALRGAERGERHARISVYGGSHTASDLYTGRMRALLQSRFGDSGHGFVPLVPVAEDAWAWGIVIDPAEGFEALQVSFKRRETFRYGLTGVAFLADEAPAWAAVTSDHWGNGRSASRIEVLYDRLPGGGSFEVWIDGALHETIETASDPPRAGLRTYELSDATHRTEVRTVGDGPVTVFGVVMEREEPGVIVDNLGLVGAKARHQLLWDEEQWATYFTRLAPDLVVFAYGNNEIGDWYLSIADHEQHLRGALARVRRHAPDASCLLVGPTGRPHALEDGSLEPSPIVVPMTEMQRRVASDVGCAFFDTVAFQGGLGAGVEWLRHDPPYMQGDLQHLTQRGYVRWGEAITRGLLAGYAER